MVSGDAGELSLANPLPRALAHYAAQLADVLSAVGVRHRELAVPSVEVAGLGSVRRTGTVVRSLTVRRARRVGDVLVLWPAFGYLEPALWRRSPSGRIFVVVHDPEPLRRQRGFGRLARAIGLRRLRGGDVTLVTHSDRATDVLRSLSFPDPVQLPHPCLSSLSGGVAAGDLPTARSADRPVVQVLGQFKPARSPEILQVIASSPIGRSCLLRLSGRGWPPSVGWNREDAFLSESDVDDRLASASVLVLPYRHYFQSNVAVRALEQLLPVAGLRTDFLEELLGPDWPGLADTVADIPAAVDAAMRVPRADMQQLLAGYRVRCVATWSRKLAELGIGTAA